MNRSCAVPVLSFQSRADAQAAGRQCFRDILARTLFAEFPDFSEFYHLFGLKPVWNFFFSPGLDRNKAVLYNENSVIFLPPSNLPYERKILCQKRHDVNS